MDILIRLFRLCFEDHLKVFELLARVLSDSAPPTQAMYVFGNTRDNQSSNLATAARRWKEGLVHVIVCCAGETEHGYIGFEFCRQNLLELGIPENAILPLPMPRVGVNTLSEAEHLVRLAKEKGWQEIVVSTPPFHQLRAFMTTVSVALREYPELKIHSAVGDPLPWGEKVVHSQGVVVATRAELVAAELAAIWRYQRKGDIASFETVLEYLAHR